jgi:hypothetical protein
MAGRYLPQDGQTNCSIRPDHWQWSSPVRYEPILARLQEHSHGAATIGTQRQTASFLPATFVTMTIFSLFGSIHPLNPRRNLIVSDHAGKYLSS